jgi:hypothetical protein
MSKYSKYHQLRQVKRSRERSRPQRGIDITATKLKTPEAKAAIPKELLSSLTSIAINVWRARKRLTAIESEELKEEARRTLRHIEAIIEALEQANLKIIDYPIGSRYDIGMPVRVIASEPSPRIKTDKIIDLVKPGIEYQGRLVQLGEVIIGTPVKR